VLYAFSAITSTFVLPAFIGKFDRSQYSEPFQTKKATSKNKDGLPAFSLYGWIDFRSYALLFPEPVRALILFR
jgi:hypothetical protein